MMAGRDVGGKDVLLFSSDSRSNLIQRKFGRRVLFALFLSLLTVTTISPHLFLIISSSSKYLPLQNTVTKDVVVSLEVPASNSTRSSFTQEIEPFIYHISPGSTGSRTLYHATCNAGFPSVHHKSFCISNQRGVNGVSSRVTQGVRAHLQVLRLYQIAYKCCSYWKKEIILQDKSNNSKVITIKDGVGGDGEILLGLCSMPLDIWARDIQTHLSTVLQSGLVGLFDTPYPLLAPQVLNITTALQTKSPIIAMTERDVTGWAKSRSRNHNLMLCKKEFSYEELGASEFDILGCVERASNTTMRDGRERVLRFWDVFEYRSRFEEANIEFLKGMELQMEHHQNMYKPIVDYAPNFFGSSMLKESVHFSSKAKRDVVTDEQVTKDIRQLVLARNETLTFKDANSTQTTLLRKEHKMKPLKCRGAVQYYFLNDTFEEHYDHPKKCASDNVEERLSLI